MIEIPGYKVHREIDHSDYCRSYSAIQLSSGKTMLVSIFSHDAQQYTLFKSIFDDIEQKIAGKVFGVITPIKEFIKTKDFTYIISDLLSNSCAQVYKEKEANVEKLIEQIYNIAASIDLYHQVGFYHGGISLDNIYHDNDGNLTLGLAAFNQHFNKNDTIKSDLSKEAYSAPEKEVNQSLSRDFYALGVVFYELIFKKKPFIADTKAELEALQNQANLDTSDKDKIHLMPLLKALLNPDPQQRLSSAEQFKTLSKAAGFDIQGRTFTVQAVLPETVTESFAGVSSERSRASTTNKSVYIAVSAAVIVLCVAAYVILMPSEESVEPLVPKVSINNDSNSLQIENSEELELSEDNNFQELIGMAQQQLSNNRLATALMNVNQALKLQSGDDKAIQLKKKIENEIKINMLSKKAQQLVKKGQILTPASDNALNVYRKMQAILPKGDMRAVDGLKEISHSYWVRANQYFQSNQNLAAKKLIEEGLSLIPTDKALKKLKSRIQQQETAEQKALALQAEQLKQEKERQELLEQQRQKEQQLALEQKQLADLKKQREQERKQQIDKIVKNVESNLKDDQLTLASINTARSFLNSLNLLPTPNTIKQDLKQKINVAYGSLAQYQFDEQQLIKLEETLNEGLDYSPTNSVLIGLKTKVLALKTQKEIERQRQAALEQQKKEESANTELPIFGTF